jgi:hypothetical protein
MATTKKTGNFLENYRDRLLAQDGDVEIKIKTNAPKKNPNAHSFILETRCKKMADEAQGPDGKKSPKEITVDDNIEGSAVCEVLRYLYTYKVHLKPENVFGVRKMARKYEINELVEECNNYIKKQMRVDTVCEFLNQSIIFEEKESKQSCINFIGSNADKVLKDDSFLTANMDVVVIISKLEYLGGVQEIVLFNSCVKWARKQEPENSNLKGKELAEKLKDILPNIRFPVMKLEEFSKDVYETKIFEEKDNESIELFTYISRPANSKPETNFKYIKEPRQQVKPAGDVKVTESDKAENKAKADKDREVEDYLKDGTTDSVWNMPI